MKATQRNFNRLNNFKDFMKSKEKGKTITFFKEFGPMKLFETFKQKEKSK
jgi:hypothetical protein